MMYLAPKFDNLVPSHDNALQDSTSNYICMVTDWRDSLCRKLITYHFSYHETDRTEYVIPFIWHILRIWTYANFETSIFFIAPNGIQSSILPQQTQTENTSTVWITVNPRFNGHMLDGRDSIPGKRRRFFSTPQRPNSLLSNAYRGLFYRR
jgi:hypothetical protein